MLPSLLFFAFGHFGSFGYLQVILPGLVIIVAAAIVPAFSAKGSLATLSLWGTGLTLMISVLFFSLGRPVPSPSTLSTKVNIIALQYTGYAVNHQIALARSSALPNYVQLSPQARAARTNGQIRAAYILATKTGEDAGRSKDSDRPGLAAKPGRPPHN
jgi:hypothetical protein